MIEAAFPKSRAEQVRDLRLDMLKGANPLKYNADMCTRIQEHTSRIDLPKLTKEEMGKLKEHLSDYKKLDGDSLRITFYNLRNCFLIVNEFEDDPRRVAKISPIIHYLDEYKYLFDLIIESQGLREHPPLEKALVILHLDISKFCMRYAYMLTDTDMNTINFSPTDMPTLSEEDTTDPNATQEETPPDAFDEPPDYEPNNNEEYTTEEEEQA